MVPEQAIPLNDDKSDLPPVMDARVDPAGKFAFVEFRSEVLRDILDQGERPCD